MIRTGLVNKIQFVNLNEKFKLFLLYLKPKTYVKILPKYQNVSYLLYLFSFFYHIIFIILNKFTIYER